MKRIMIFMTGILLLAASVGFSQSAGLGIGPQIGYQKAKDADNGKLMFGGAVRLKLSPALGVEGSINYRQEKYADGDLTVKSWPVLVTGLLYPFPMAYGAIGAGWYNTKFDYSDELNEFVDDERKQEFGWHFGAGVEIPAGTSTKLTADIKYVFLNYDFKEVPGLGDISSNFYIINLGLLFGL